MLIPRIRVRIYGITLFFHQFLIYGSFEFTEFVIESR